LYDGDGVRVGTVHFTGASGTPDSTTSYFMGGQYEIKDGATKKYYSIAGMMVAVNDGTGLQYLLTDHLGSTVAVTNSSGTLTSQQRYLPFGGTRAIPNSPILATDFGYTGQRLLDSGMGEIMDYKARFYSPYLNRFIQPDTIIPKPANPQAFNRFSYVLNDPIRYNDPTGHMMWEGDGGGCYSCAPTPPVDPPGSGDNDCPVNNPNCILNPDRDIEINTDTDNDGFPNIPDPYADPIVMGSYSDPNCMVEELVECFYRRGRLPSGEYTLTDEQLESLMLAVYLDIENRPLSPSTWKLREVYDTPLWDGYGADNGNICTTTGCYGRNEANYFAQGIFSAKFEGEALGEIIVQLWKIKEYQHLASEGTIYWFEKGYDFYHAQQTCSWCGVPTK
jgi:RHS repeat-associated protein